MKISFEDHNHSPDDYVRIYVGDEIILAISSVSKHYPGLWKSDNIRITGVDIV
jgi:hypothetical protein